VASDPSGHAVEPRSATKHAASEQHGRVEEGGGPEIDVVRIGFVVLAGMGAIVASFVVTYVIVATIVLGVVRIIRGPSEPDPT
jgi:hypothetical protein